jgi:hypothetical protein
MPRLLALPLAAAAVALALPSAPAQAACYPDKSLSYVGVCVGSGCTEFCPIVVDPYCELERPRLAACVLVDSLEYHV